MSKESTVCTHVAACGWQEPVACWAVAKQSKSSFALNGKGTSCLSFWSAEHAFFKSIFPLGFSLGFFYSDARALNAWGGKKEKGAGGGGWRKKGISNGNPDGLNHSCCLCCSASCNLHGQMPVWHLIHAWLLKVQAKGTAVLEQEGVCQGRKMSSSAKLLLGLRDGISNFKEIKWRCQSLVRFGGQLISRATKVGSQGWADTQQTVNAQVFTDKVRQLEFLAKTHPFHQMVLSVRPSCDSLRNTSLGHVCAQRSVTCSGAGRMLETPLHLPWILLPWERAGCPLRSREGNRGGIPLWWVFPSRHQSQGCCCCWI